MVGCQIGSRDPKATAKHLEISAPGVDWHNEQSFAKMWDDIGRESETKWEVEARLVGYEIFGWKVEDVAYLGPDCCVMEWVATRKA